MIIRALDVNHDWMFGQGKQSYQYGNNAIMENVQTRLLEFLNDCFFNLGAGIDWVRLLSSKNTEKELLASTRSVILKSYGIVQVNSVTYSLVGRHFTVTYNVDSIYTQNITQSTEVLNV